MTAVVWLTQNVWRAATGLQQCNQLTMEELTKNVAGMKFRMTATLWLTQNVWKAASARMLQQCNQLTNEHCGQQVYTGWGVK